MMLRIAYFCRFAFLSCLLWAGSSVFAQNNPPSLMTGDGPIEITAQDSLEWLRDERRFIARGDALAEQGDMSVKAQVLEAFYHDDAENGFALTQFIARDNVSLSSGENRLYGQNAVYDVKSGVATLTGNNLKMTGPRATITASERFEYLSRELKVRAIGNARVTREDTTLTSDILTAHLIRTDQGKTVIERVNASGGVEIQTPTETLRGDKGVYYASSNTAEVNGNVILQRGGSMLQGERAVIDLTTNVSKLFGGETNNERVKGVFYPEKTP